MYCKKCGNVIENNEKFCSVCGAKVESDSPYENYSQGNHLSGEKPTYYQTTLILGVLSVVFSALNYFGVIFVHLIGIILGSIALNYAKRDKETFGKFNTTGRLLAIIGLLLGVAAFVYGVIYSVMYLY